MHYFDEYCEVHLDPNLAPCQWVFHHDEPIDIKFGVALTHEPQYGLVQYHLNDGRGYQKSGTITAQIEKRPENDYQFFYMTLPKLNEGQIHYRLGYRDTKGQRHLSKRTRRVFICDEAPRSLRDIPSHFLGVVDDSKPMGGDFFRGGRL